MGTILCIHLFNYWNRLSTYRQNWWVKGRRGQTIFFTFITTYVQEIIRSRLMWPRYISAYNSNSLWTKGRIRK